MTCTSASSDATSSGPFTISDVFIPGSVLGITAKFLGFRSRRQRLGLVLVMCAPLAVLSLVSRAEGRFALGSLTTALPSGEQAVGMSFLGDTMVWPFSFIVPIAFLLLVVAAHRSVRLLNAIATQVVQTSEDATGAAEMARMVQSAKRTLGRQGGRLGLALRLGPWIVAIAFWSYNTVTCALHDVLPDGCYPYRASTVSITPPGGGDPAAGPRDVNTIRLALDDPVALPKWDCDIRKAPMSCIGARIWTLIFYGIPPFILAGLVGLVVGVVNFLTALEQCGRAIGSEGQCLGELKPFAPDGFGGLGTLADTGMSYIYVLSSFTLMVSMGFFKEGAQRSWHNVAMLVFFLPVAISVFAAPSAAVRGILVRAKRLYLDTLARELNGVAKRICGCTEEKPCDPGSDQRDFYRLQSLKLLYDHVSSVPEWPFSSRTVTRMALSLGLPVLLVLLDKLLSLLMGV